MSEVWDENWWGSTRHARHPHLDPAAQDPRRDRSAVEDRHGSRRRLPLRSLRRLTTVRRRLVLSTIAVVTVVILVLLVPVLLIVRDAEGGELPAGVIARLAVIAVAAIAAAALLAGIQARQLARPLERLARSACTWSARVTSVPSPLPPRASPRSTRLHERSVSAPIGSIGCWSRSEDSPPMRPISGCVKPVTWCRHPAGTARRDRGSGRRCRGHGGTGAGPRVELDARRTAHRGPAGFDR